MAINNNGNLPDNFNDFFTSVSTRHQYRIRLASKSTFSLPAKLGLTMGNLILHLLVQKLGMLSKKYLSL